MNWMQRIAWWLYQLVLGSLMLLLGPWVILRRRQHYWPTLLPRLGLGRQPPTSPQRPLWIHAVSVGEVGVAATLARALPPDLPLLVTTVTPTGQAQARKIFSGENARHRASVAYLPFDLGFAVGRFYRRHRPRGLVLIEGDYWPLVLEGARRRQLPVVVVNGRVGARAAARQRRLASFCRRVFFAPVRLFAVQTARDEQRLIASGAPEQRLHVTGNLKFDSARPQPKPELEAILTRLAAGRPMVLAGSTMAGEEAIVVDAFQASGAERAWLVLAPRHPERAPEVLQQVRRRGLQCLLRSELSSQGEPPPPQVVVLDTLGELAALYRLADIAFIGGTLVPTGGHNPLEPAHFAKPIVVGPAMDNFRDMAEQFDEADAWKRAADGAELAEILGHWLEHPDAAMEVGRRGHELLVANRGAVDRTWRLIRPVLDL